MLCNLSSHTLSAHYPVVTASVPPRCQNIGDPSRPYRRSFRSEAPLCIALTLNPVSIYQCLLSVAQTGFSTEAMGAHDYTEACLGPLGTSSLLTSAAVNYTPGIYGDWWLNRAWSWSEDGERESEIGRRIKLLRVYYHCAKAYKPWSFHSEAYSWSKESRSINGGAAVSQFSQKDPLSCVSFVKTGQKNWVKVQWRLLNTWLGFRK